MRIVGTALVAGTIGVFCLLAQGEWIRAETGEPAEGERAIPRTHHKVWSGHNQFRELQGMKVQNVDGEKIGTVSDLIIELRSGVPKYVIVRSGRIAAGHRRSVIVPISAIALRTAKSGIAAVDISKRKWRYAPEFTRKDLEWIGQPEKARQIVEFYGPPENVPLVAKTAEAQRESLSSIGRADQTSRPNQLDNHQLASELIGNEVIARQQREVGTISDLLVDATGMKPAFALLSADSRSAQDPTFAVPLKMLRPMPGRKIVISANRQDFERATPFKGGVNSAAGGGNEIYRYGR
jgi:sporulation protein YlmC with PRC-barrel domain